MPRSARVWTIVLLAYFSVAPLRLAAQPPQRRSTPNDTLKSIEVADDLKVTFRIYAPKATEVSVSGDFGSGGKLAEDEQGVWSITVGPLPRTITHIRSMSTGSAQSIPRIPS